MNLLEKILVPVDIEAKYHHHIDAALALAENYESTIILLYVLPEEVLGSKTKEIAVKYVETELNKIKDKVIKDKPLKCEIHVEYGKIYETIAYVADLKDANLIVMPAGQPANPGKFCIRTERVIRESEIAVYAVKQGDKFAYKHILCPIDFSKPSKIALTNAIRFAKRFGIKLTIMHVIEGSILPKFLTFSESEKDIEEEIAEYGERIIHFAEKSSVYSVPYEIVVKKGAVSEQILQFIRENQVDMLILGTTGGGGLKKMIMGSVTERIIADVPCSMIITETEDILEAKLSHEIDTLETHFKLAENLENNNFLNEAIGELKICLHINDFHLPSYYALIRIHNKLEESHKADEYKNHLSKIIDIQHNKAIENEIRRNYFLED
jgi:nucleotide-binding universal stress UspA family protein